MPHPGQEYRGELCHGSLTLVYGAGFHEDDFPYVSIQILKPVSIHKPVVLWFIVGGSASGDGLAHELIDVFSAVDRETHKHFSAFRGITNGFGRERLKLVMSQEHHEDVIAHDHAGGCLVSKLGVKTEAEFRKELDRPLEAFDWKIYEDFRGHVFSFLLSARAESLPMTRDSRSGEPEIDKGPPGPINTSASDRGVSLGYVQEPATRRLLRPWSGSSTSCKL
jgi:hypothetical protein